MTQPPTHRALLLTGAAAGRKNHAVAPDHSGPSRQGVPPAKILYATFDHPLLKLIGLDGLLNLWRELEPRTRRRRVSVPGRNPVHQGLANLAQASSGLPQEPPDRGHRLRHSAGGRRAGIRRGPLAHRSPGHPFLLRVPPDQKIPSPDLPALISLTHLFEWPANRFAAVAADARAAGRPFSRVSSARRFPAKRPDGEHPAGAEAPAGGHRGQGAQARHDRPLWRSPRSGVGADVPLPLHARRRPAGHTGPLQKPWR